MRRAVPSTVEIAIGPHPARPEWSVLRVSYPQEPGHTRRIAQALDVLLASGEAPADETAPADLGRQQDTELAEAGAR